MHGTKKVKSTSIAVSTRVRLSGSVGSNNLTTASSMQHRLISLQQTRIFFCRLKTKVWRGGLVATPHNLHAEQVSEGIPPARELLAQDCNSSYAKKCHGSKLSDKQITDNRNCPIRSLEGLTPGKFRSNDHNHKKGKKNSLSKSKRLEKLKRTVRLE